MYTLARKESFYSGVFGIMFFTEKRDTETQGRESTIGSQRVVRNSIAGFGFDITNHRKRD